MRWAHAVRRGIGPTPPPTANRGRGVATDHLRRTAPERSPAAAPPRPSGGGGGHGRGLGGGQARGRCAPPGDASGGGGRHFGAQGARAPESPLGGGGGGGGGINDPVAMSVLGSGCACPTAFIAHYPQRRFQRIQGLWGVPGREENCSAGGGGLPGSPFSQPPPSFDGRGGFRAGVPDLPCRGGGGVNPTSMAQNDTHVALIILTTQMWGGGGGIIGGKNFFGPNHLAEVVRSKPGRRIYGKTPHTPPFWPFWGYSRTLPQGVELLV